ncbi:MAG: glycosyltransferase family 4 protein [bacterium]
MTNREPLRVWHVDSGRRPGGGQIQISYLLKGLVERGVSCTLVCPPKSPIVNLGIPGSVEVVHLGLWGEWDFLSARRLKRLVWYDAPHIIHAHDARSHTLCLLARSKDQRVVVHRRVSFPIRQHILTPLKYGSSVDRFIAVAGCVRDELILAHVPKGRISVIHSAVDTSRFHGEYDRESIRAEFGLRKDEIIIGTVGRLTKEKRHAWMLETLRPVLREHPLSRVMVVGSGPEDSRLKRLAARLGIRERILFTGHREDIHRLLPILDVFLLCSESEGYPVSLAEAMAAGCAVVSTNVGAVRELVDSNEDGVLISPDDTAALRDAVSGLLADADRRSTLGRAAHESARSSLGIDSMVDKVLEVYNNLYTGSHEG